MKGYPVGDDRTWSKSMALMQKLKVMAMIHPAAPLITTAERMDLLWEDSQYFLIETQDHKRRERTRNVI